VKPVRYTPDRGDIVWLDFDPQAGREQRGKRPGLVLSPAAYNGRVGLALCCPVTSRVKGYPFEVVIPPGLKAEGAVLADHVRSLDWRARGAKLWCPLPPATVDEVTALIQVLLVPARVA
jgi:mRNA interferase MazF